MATQTADELPIFALSSYCHGAVWPNVAYTFIVMPGEETSSHKKIGEALVEALGFEPTTDVDAEGVDVDESTESPTGGEGVGSAVSDESTPNVELDGNDLGESGLSGDELKESAKAAPTDSLWSRKKSSSSSRSARSKDRSSEDRSSKEEKSELKKADFLIDLDVGPKEVKSETSSRNKPDPKVKSEGRAESEGKVSSFSGPESTGSSGSTYTKTTSKKKFDKANASDVDETSAFSRSGSQVSGPIPPPVGRAGEVSYTRPRNSARSATFGEHGHKVRARKVRRVIRHVDPWSVLTFSTLFHLCVFAALLLASVLVWNAASGPLENLEDFIRELGDYQTFEIDGNAVFRAALVIMGVLTLASSVLVVLLAVVFNLISDLVGGIRITVVEEDTVRVPKESDTDRPAPVTSPPTRL